MGDLRADDLPAAALTAVRHLHIGSWFLHLRRGRRPPRPARARPTPWRVDVGRPQRRPGPAVGRAPAARAASRGHAVLQRVRGAGRRGEPPAGPGTGHATTRPATSWAGSPRAAPSSSSAARRAPSSTPRTRRCTLPRPTADVVDTVGAGDSLAAGFLHARLEGRDLSSRRCASRVAAGTLSTRRSGGVDAQPTCDEANAARRAADLPHRKALAAEPGLRPPPPTRGTHSDDTRKDPAGRHESSRPAARPRPPAQERRARRHHLGVQRAPAGAPGRHRARARERWHRAHRGDLEPGRPDRRVHRPAPRGLPRPGARPRRRRPSSP